MASSAALIKDPIAVTRAITPAATATKGLSIKVVFNNCTLIAAAPDALSTSPMDTACAASALVEIPAATASAVVIVFINPSAVVAFVKPVASIGREIAKLVMV